MTPDNKLRQADDLFYEVSQEFRLYHYLSPVNQEEEKQRFLEAFDRGKTYNPVFAYNPIPSAVSGYKQRLGEILLGTSALEVAFDRVRQELLATLEMTESRGTPAVTQLSARVYGSPTDELVAEATQVLQACPADKSNQQRVGVKALLEQLRTKLRTDQIEGWDVRTDPDCLFLAEADWTSHKVRVREGTILSEQMLRRLLHHLIEVHVYRAANGERQPYKAFSLGLDQHLITEEGLAVLLEEKMGLLSPLVMRRYAARVVAVREASQLSFSALFAKLIKLLDFEEAYTLAERCKIGLEDTAGPGGLVREHIYFAGRQLVDGLTPADLSTLYMGRVGVHHLPLVRELAKDGKLMEPVFFPKALRT